MKNLSLLLLASVFVLTPVRVNAMMEPNRSEEEKKSEGTNLDEEVTRETTKGENKDVIEESKKQGNLNFRPRGVISIEERVDVSSKDPLDTDTDSDYGENPHNWEEEGNKNLSLKDFRKALRRPINRNASRLIIINNNDGKDLIKAVPENPDTPIQNSVEDHEITNLLKALIALEQPTINIEDLFDRDSSLSAERLNFVFDLIDQAIAEQKKASARIVPGSDQEQLVSLLHSVILKRAEKPSRAYAKADKLWVQQQQAWEDKTILERELKNRTSLHEQAKNFLKQVQEAYDKIDLENTISGRLAHVAEKAAILCAMVPEPHVQILGEVAAGLAWSADKFNKIWAERDVNAARAALQEIQIALQETKGKLNETNEKVGTLKDKAKEKETYARHTEAQSRKAVAETLHPPVGSHNEADWNTWATKIVTEGKGEPIWITRLIESGMTDPDWIAEETGRAWKKRLLIAEEKIREQKKEIKEHMKPLNHERYKNNKVLQKAQIEEQTTQKEFEEQREKHQRLKAELETLGQTQDAFEAKYKEVSEAAQKLALKEKAWLEAQERLTHQDRVTLLHKNKHAIKKALLLRNLTRTIDQVKIDTHTWGYNNQLTSWLPYRLPEGVAEQVPQKLKTEGEKIPPPIPLDEELEKLGKRLWTQEKRSSSAQAFSLVEHQRGEKKSELLEQEQATPLKEAALPPTVAELVASIIIPTPKDLERWKARENADERIRERDALFAERKERYASMNEPKGVKPRANSMVSLFSYWGGSIIGSTPAEDKAVNEVTKAEKLWFDLAQEADAKRRGIGYSTQEELCKHWEQADRAAHKAWEERALLQKEATLATHIKDEEEWNNDVDRWMARENADKLHKEFKEADDKKRKLHLNQKSLDAAWNKDDNEATQEVDRLRPLMEAAEKRWIALANQEESVSMAFEEAGEAAEKEAREKLEPQDRAAMKLWKKVKEMSPEERLQQRMATFAKEKERIVTQPTMLIERGSESDRPTLNNIEDVLLYKLEAEEQARKEKIEQAAKNYLHDEQAKKVWEEELTFEERHLYNINNEDANVAYIEAAQKKIEEAQNNYDAALEASKGVFILSSKKAALVVLKQAKEELLATLEEEKKRVAAIEWARKTPEKRKAQVKGFLPKAAEAQQASEETKGNISGAWKKVHYYWTQAAEALKQGELSFVLWEEAAKKATEAAELYASSAKEFAVGNDRGKEGGWNLHTAAWPVLKSAEAKAEAASWRAKQEEALTQEKKEEAVLWEEGISKALEASQLFDSSAKEHAAQKTDGKKGSKDLDSAAWYALKSARVKVEVISWKRKKEEALLKGSKEEAVLWEESILKALKASQLYDSSAKKHAEEKRYSEGGGSDLSDAAESTLESAEAKAEAALWKSKQEEALLKGNKEETALWEGSINKALEASQLYDSSAKVYAAGDRILNGRWLRYAAESTLKSAKGKAEAALWQSKKAEALLKGNKEEVALWEESINKALEASQLYDSSAEGYAAYAAGDSSGRAGGFHLSHAAESALKSAEAKAEEAEKFSK